MRNQSAKNPKVFPASTTTTLGDTLRNGAVNVSEREKATKLMHYGFVRDTSRLAWKPFGPKPVHTRARATFIPHTCVDIRDITMGLGYRYCTRTLRSRINRHVKKTTTTTTTNGNGNVFRSETSYIYIYIYIEMRAYNAVVTTGATKDRILAGQRRIIQIIIIKIRFMTTDLALHKTMATPVCDERIQLIGNTSPATTVSDLLRIIVVARDNCVGSQYNVNDK